MTRTALVTGASGGIGLGVSRALFAERFRLVLACRDPYVIDVQGEFNDEPWEVAMDVGGSRSVQETVNMVEGDSWKIDTLVLCHAAAAGTDLLNSLIVDVYGAWNVIEAVLPGMVRQGFGRIVLFSSIRAHHPRPGQEAYATAKSAIEGLTRALAVDYGPHGILTNCIAPGAVLTPRTLANIAAGVVSEAELLARTPTGRLATVDDVARAVLWLVSDECPVNGKIITVDGGWSENG